MTAQTHGDQAPQGALRDLLPALPSRSSLTSARTEAAESRGAPTPHPGGGVLSLPRGWIEAQPRFSPGWVSRTPTQWGQRFLTTHCHLLSSAGNCRTDSCRPPKLRWQGGPGAAWLVDSARVSLPEGCDQVSSEYCVAVVWEQLSGATRSWGPQAFTVRGGNWGPGPPETAVLGQPSSSPSA